VEAALAAAEQTADHTDATRRALELELRQARYEADRAQRQYDAAEPEHRLVVDTLERRWNDALERVAEIEQRLDASRGDTRRSTAVGRDRLLELAQNFPGVWNHPRTDIQLKKRIVRLVIEEIVANVTTDPPQVSVLIHWKGGKHTPLVVRKNRTGEHRHGTDRAIIDVARDLARTLPDAQIARILNRLGYHTGHGNAWTTPRVATLRNSHSIPVFDRAAPTPWLTMAEAATVLGISAMTTRRLILQKILPATQPVPYAPWAIRREDLELPPVRRAVVAIKDGRRCPRPSPDAQLVLTNSIT
jgi:excisionase family DNA binding protein